MQQRRCLAGAEHCSILELFSATATHADKMVMIAMGIVGQFVAATTLRQLKFLQQAQRTQQPQGAINGGQRHPLLPIQQLLVHLLGTEMATLATALEHREHTLPLGSEPPAQVVETAAQAPASLHRRQFIVRKVQPLAGSMSGPRHGSAQRLRAIHSQE